MSAPTLTVAEPRDRLGLKGPRAAEWLVAQRIVLPMAPNTWTHSEQTEGADALLVARLGTGEFFLEDGAAGTSLKRLSPSLDEPPPGVYPVLREDFAFHLGGERVHEVLAQVCNVNFAALPLDSRPLIMTLMIGVAVLVVPQSVAGGEPGGSAVRSGSAERDESSERDGSADRCYRIWCDPSFGPYLSESLGKVVVECGGIHGSVG
jgi:sarcosine oxidase subunit gamma